MDPSTLLYKASFDNNEFESGQFPNRSLNVKYKETNKFGDIVNLDITGEAVNTYMGGNILSLGYEYLGLPSITELERDLEKEMKKLKRMEDQTVLHFYLLCEITELLQHHYESLDDSHKHQRPH